VSVVHIRIGCDAPECPATLDVPRRGDDREACGIVFVMPSESDIRHQAGWITLRWAPSPGSAVSWILCPLHALVASRTMPASIGNIIAPTFEQAFAAGEAVASAGAAGAAVAAAALAAIGLAK
jgi:hypothetical protein